MRTEIYTTVTMLEPEFSSWEDLENANDMAAISAVNALEEGLNTLNSENLSSNVGIWLRNYPTKILSPGLLKHKFNSSDREWCIRNFHFLHPYTHDRSTVVVLLRKVGIAELAGLAGLAELKY